MTALSCSPLRSLKPKIKLSPLNVRFATAKISPKPRDVDVKNLGRAIVDDFAQIRAKYRTKYQRPSRNPQLICSGTPKHPIVLAHGLLGFDELHLVGAALPGIHYWRGIAEALRKNGMEVITTSVPASSSIEERAAKLSSEIEVKAGGKTTSLPRIFRALRALRIETGAFTQLTRRFMQEDFNPKTPNREGVRYLSYGASVDPPIWSAFKRSHRIVEREEGANDGLVSVESSKWGEYKGTLVNVSHLDLINWTNRLRWLVWEMTGNKRNFNAIAFYLDIGDMLAKEGL
ncbi:MAG: hypothetical protein L6R36_002677 [Xanthoria steineri]|nr:MAG: hypothetical protein L6R36_002677 [Xanthoria steineri]